MILLDTNVLSELIRPTPNAVVLDWFTRQTDAELFTSAITEAEMLLGVRLLPAGKRRKELEGLVQAMFAEDLAGRVLPFDNVAALHYAQIAADRRSAGRPISQFDAQIAGIARAYGAVLATRNTADFEGCGVILVNPWMTTV